MGPSQTFVFDNVGDIKMSTWESEMTPEDWQSVHNKSWSKQYYEGLTETQHRANDDWFKTSLNLLKNTGILGVPNLQKFINKNGKETL